MFIIKDSDHFFMLELKMRQCKNKIISKIMTTDDVKLQWCKIAPKLKDERATQEVLKLIT